MYNISLMKINGHFTTLILKLIRILFFNMSKNSEKIKMISPMEYDIILSIEWQDHVSFLFYLYYDTCLMLHIFYVKHHNCTGQKLYNGEQKYNCIQKDKCLIKLLVLLRLGHYYLSDPLSDLCVKVPNYNN